MQTQSLLLTLFKYKAWANEELFDTLGTLSSTRHADETHQIARILNHIHVVDRIFHANLQNREHGLTALNTEHTPSLSELQAAYKELDQWYVDFIASIADEDLIDPIKFVFTDGKPGHMTRGEMLMHVATHGNYHRGAVGRILTQIDIKPPRDSMTVFLHQTA